MPIPRVLPGPQQTALAALGAGAAVLTLAGPAAAATPPDPVRGSVVAARHLYARSPEAVAQKIRRDGRAGPGVRVSTRGLDTTVDGYRIRYQTIDAEGRPTTATGLLALPREGPRRPRTLAYLHGTIVSRADAPSVSGRTFSASMASYYAAAGYAVVAPDYLGLGGGPGRHPYIDAPSQTTAAADLLRAADRVAAGRGRTLDRTVQVTGFSQGGLGTMALGEALQAGEVPGWHAGALAPVGGPFDLQGVELPGALSGAVDPAVATFYLGYLLTSWDRLHDLGLRPDELFLPPYSGTLDRLFDGRRSEETVARGLPPRVEQLLTPRALELLRRPTGPLLTALRRNDGRCSSWTPRVPVRLYVGRRDTDVPPANSTACLRDLRAHGVRAKVVDLGATGHNGSAFRALPRTLAWLRSQR